MSTLQSFNGLSRALFAALILCTLTPTIGCANVEDDEFDGEELLDEASDALMVDAATENLPARGGPGGVAYAPALCPSGSVATGLNLRTGDWVDNIQMQCTFLNDDGTLGAKTTTVSRGGSGGSPVSGSCPTGQVLNAQIVGIVGADDAPGTYVGKLGGRCASLSRILASGAGFDSSVGPFGRQGTVQETACPQGQAVVGFYGRAGWWTDEVGFICARVQMPHVASYPVNAVHGIPASIDSVNLNASGSPAINVAPGASVNLHAAFNITQNSTCPFCINQILIGLGPNTLGVGGESPKGCIYSDIPSMTGTSGSGSTSFTAPTVPGIYPIRFRTGGAYSCDLNWWAVDFTPGAEENIGFINVF